MEKELMEQLRDMKVGDSFKITVTQRANLLSIARQLCILIRTRSVTSEPGIIRVWKIS